MSCSALLNYSRNKELDLFGQRGVESLGNDFFEQFIIFDQEALDCSAPSETTLRERSVFRATAAPSPRLQKGPSNCSIVQNRPSELWVFTEHGASHQHTLDQGSHFYSEITGRAAISDTELLSLEGVSLYSPQNPATCYPSLPSSPTVTSGSLARKRHRVVKPLLNTFQRESGSSTRALRSPIRKSTPKMTTTSRYNQPTFRPIKIRF